MSILFLKDWKTEDGRLRAIPHSTTTNKSFLRTAQLLRKMNIKNWAFSLALYDPDLLNVNVHDLEEDTAENAELRIKVMVEARRNIWYFLRECIRIYEQGGAPISFRLDRGSAAMTWCFLNGLDYCGMQPRQTGKALPNDANILSDSGWIKMGDVTEDTKLITPDGETASVIGIFPQGIKDIYRIALEDGETAECCDEHLWRVYCKEWEDDWQVIPLSDIRSSLDKIYIPVGGTLQAIKFIEYVGKKEAQCISIDHPDQLFITDNYIVTHNTVCALSLTAWVLYSSGYEYTIGMLSKDSLLRQENVKRVKTFGENLPKWWLAEDRYKDKKNAEELLYAALKTHYVTFVAQSDKAAADKQGRGSSLPMIHIDEFEFCSNIGTTYSAIVSSTGTARENAKKNGLPHSNLITTTAGDPMKPECQQAAKILAAAMPFTELLYDTDDSDKLHEIVEATSPAKMIIGVFSHLQLGHDNEWLRERINRGNLTRDQVMRDFLNRRVSIADQPIIPPPTLALINQSQREPTHLEPLNNKFVIYWYIPEEQRKSREFKDRPIVVGCDSSEMIGRDATTLIGVDPRTLETVFSFRASEGNINVVGVMIANLLLTYPKFVFVPENKSSGTSIIDVVSMILRKEGHNPFTRMYNRVVDEKHTEEMADIDIRDTSLMDTSIKRFFGIKTDKGKRDELYSTTLLDAVKRAPDRVRDQMLIQELNSLTVRNGRVDHGVGGHDDTCFVGSTLVRTDTGNRPMSDLKVGDLVLTREGYKPILHIFCKEKEVISRFNLVGTPEHPFITPNGIVPFEDLTLESMVYVWDERLSCTTERRIIDTLTPKKQITETIFIGTTKIKNLLLHCVDRYGKTIKALSQKVFISITWTKTFQTTPSATTNVYLQKNIEANTLSLTVEEQNLLSSRKKMTTLVSGVRKILRLPESTQVTTEKTVQGCPIGEETTPKKPKQWQSKLGRKVLRSGLPTELFLKAYRTGEKIILKRLKRSTGLLQRKPLKQDGVRKEIVYNLFVAECHEYFVNDILVHNCIAWLMAMWFILNGKHLDIYGIKPGTVLSYLNPGQPDKNRLSEERQQNIRDRIESLQDALKYQSDPSLKKLVESDITMLRGFLEHGPPPAPATADELVRDPKRYTDTLVAEASRTPVDMGSLEKSLKMMFRV